MNKDMIPEVKSEYNSSRELTIGDVDEKYIDKGNLTSRECGKLVKGMVDDYYQRRWK